MFSLLKVFQIQNLFYLKKNMDLVQFGLVFVSNNYKSNDNVLVSTKNTGKYVMNFSWE